MKIHKEDIIRFLKKEERGLPGRVVDIIIGLAVTAFILWIGGKIIDSSPVQKGWKKIVLWIKNWAFRRRTVTVERMLKAV